MMDFRKENPLRMNKKNHLAQNLCERWGLCWILLTAQALPY